VQRNHGVEDVTELAKSQDSLALETSLLEGAAPLEAILCTEELRKRMSRSPNHEKENSALVALCTALADSPRTILQTLADKVLDVLDADSAGLSLLTKDGTRFYWLPLRARGDRTSAGPRRAISAHAAMCLIAISQCCSRIGNGDAPI
jgi:hypothetical protein